MKKQVKNTKQVISEMKEMLSQPTMLLEGFFLPEEDKEMGSDDMTIPEDSFDEESTPKNVEQQPIQDKNDITGIEKELTQIRKIALSVINRLADQPQSPQYDTMKKIWNMVDKAIEQPTKPNQTA